LEKGLVRIVGKRDEPGRPLLYGTTPLFLETFSMEDLSSLPTLRALNDLESEEAARRAFETDPAFAERYAAAIETAGNQASDMNDAEGTMKPVSGPDATPDSVDEARADEAPSKPDTGPAESD
jgi:segregation and condensation protein B